MSTLLQELGLSQDEIRQRVIDKMADELFTSAQTGEDGETAYYRESELKKDLDKLVTQRIDQKIGQLFEQHCAPHVEKQIEEIVLQETNSWGEKSGKSKPIGIIEYMVQRIDHFITEQVDYRGKSKREANDYGWSGKTTRIAFMINDHLQYSVESAVKQALQTANSQIAQGIEEAVKVKLQEVLKNVKCDVKI